MSQEQAKARAWSGRVVVFGFVLAMTGHVWVPGVTISKLILDTYLGLVFFFFVGDIAINRHELLGAILKGAYEGYFSATDNTDDSND